MTKSISNAKLSLDAFLQVKTNQFRSKSAFICSERTSQAQKFSWESFYSASNKVETKAKNDQFWADCEWNKNKKLG